MVICPPCPSSPLSPVVCQVHGGGLQCRIPGGCLLGLLCVGAVCRGLARPPALPPCVPAAGGLVLHFQRRPRVFVRVSQARTVALRWPQKFLYSSTRARALSLPCRPHPFSCRNHVVCPPILIPSSLDSPRIVCQPQVAQPCLVSVCVSVCRVCCLMRRVI